MRKITIFITLFIVIQMLPLTASAQGYMATKLRLDSLKVGKFHGSASIGGKVEQTDNFTVQINGALECMVPFKKHKLRFAGNVTFNTINTFDNGNRGFGFVAGDFFQYHIDDKINTREKNCMFFTLMGGAQYDFCRDMHCRLFAGMFMTFQPLRKHKHLCLEPGFGMIMDFSYWNVLAGASRKPILDYYNQPEHDVMRAYLGIYPDGYKWQQDPSVAVSVNFMGEWNYVAFNLYTLVAQPVTPPFENDKIEEYLPNFMQNMFNNNIYPLITIDGAVEFKIWKMLSFKVGFEFLWDGGQLPNDHRTVVYEGAEIELGARDIRYCITGGLAFHW